MQDRERERPQVPRVYTIGNIYRAVRDRAHGVSKRASLCFPLGGDTFINSRRFDDDDAVSNDGESARPPRHADDRRVEADESNGRRRVFEALGTFFRISVDFFHRITFILSLFYY